METPRHLTRSFQNISAREPAPLHWQSAAFRRRNELLAAHRIDLLLTGLGGDEVFFGYSMAPLYMADLLRHGRLLSLFNEARR